MPLIIESTLATLALLSSGPQISERANFDVASAAPATAPSAVTRGVALAGAPGRGVPSLLLTPRGAPPPASLSVEAAARQQLAEHGAAYGVSPAVLAAARTLFVHDLGRGGIIVALRQTVAGVDLSHGDIKLLLDRSRRLVAISGALHPDAHPGAAQRFELGPDAAIAAALRDLHGAAGAATLVASGARDGWQHYTLAPGQRLGFLAPARARPVYVPLGERLVPAYQVELQTTLDGRDHGHQFIVAAADGRLLMRRDATLHAARQYRVYAGADGDRRPLDGPLVDFNPHPTGVPGEGPKGASDSALVTVDGLNTNPDGQPDPWVPADGIRTYGNNVDAYLDRNATNPVNNRVRALETAPGVFDYSYDIALPATASEEQGLAALTHLFYVTNWLHDWWYDSGFVEAAGNGQRDNYGRGGAAGDPLLAESQDGVTKGHRSLARLFTTWDGASSRLEAFVLPVLDGDAGPERDVSLDSVVIAHEWTHFLHTRLVECGTQSCRAQGEGWGDFGGLLLSARDGDDLDAAFVTGVWGSLDKTGYFNVRRVAYSVDPAHNALSLRHISDGEPLPDTHPLAPAEAPNSQVHNAGEIWATMLWESYVALQKAHADDLGFDGVRRLMSDYIVSGMMLAPHEPTFTEQRDALLLAIGASSEADMLTVAGAFARRGAGACAVSPPRYSIDLTGVVEDFEVRGRGVIVGATLDDSLESCDQDGVVDVGERGRLALDIFNGGVAALPAGTIVEVVDPDPALVFPNGPTAVVPALAAWETATVAIEVAVDDQLAAPKAVALRLRVTTPGGCEAPYEQIVHARVHADLAASGASVDDVEAGAAWTPTGELASRTWTRVSGPDGHHWQGVNLSPGSDTALVSPPLTVAKGQDLVVTFDHAFRFDRQDDIAYDGGVIEVSDDDGATWHDVAMLVSNPGYNGTITGVNALSNRLAFVRDSLDYPALKPRELNFGTKLAGLTVRLRFRIATNTVRAAAGWTIDDLRFEGLASGPFPHWVANAAACAPGETGGDEPTTGGPGGDPGDSSSGGGDSDSDSASAGSATAGGNAEDAGCGCASEPRPAGVLGHALALLLLLGRRRRPSR